MSYSDVFKSDAETTVYSDCLYANSVQAPLHIQIINLSKCLGSVVYSASTLSSFLTSYHNTTTSLVSSSQCQHFKGGGLKVASKHI